MFFIDIELYLFIFIYLAHVLIFKFGEVSAKEKIMREKALRS